MLTIYFYNLRIMLLILELSLNNYKPIVKIVNSADIEKLNNH